MDPNQHIKGYLSYYLSFSRPPQYAVLLNGPWGVGKTFLVKHFVESLDKEEFNYVYVSLYGVTSLDDIDNAIFRSMYPILDSKGIKIGSQALKAIGRHINFDIDIRSKDFLDKAKSDLYIFDDLERSKLSTNTVMGYINGFVEHDGCKVVIIANEDEIKDRDDYLRIREKLIGKTLQVQSILDQAMTTFIDLIKNEKTKSAIKNNLSVISEIYHQSELNNLRVLQQTIWDFERVYESLNENHQANNVAITALLELFFVLSFEIKAGRLTADNLRERQINWLSSFVRKEKKEDETLPIDKTKKRYPAADLSSLLLSDETLINIISKGIVDQQQIRKELDQSVFFVTVAQEPSWRTVWNSHERTEEEVENSLVQMEREFAAHDFTATGEILHVFGLRLWLAKLGAIQKTKDEVITECKSYVDYLYQNGLLELPSSRGNFIDLSFNSYGGLGFHETDTSEYQELLNYLEKHRQAADIDRRPDIAEELLDNMTADPSLFLRRVCLTNQGESEFYNVPILASLNPKRFAENLLDLHPRQQKTVLIALKLRYKDGRLDRELAEERHWAENVRNCLFGASKDMSPISRNRMQEIVAYGFDDVFSSQQPVNQ